MKKKTNVKAGSSYAVGRAMNTVKTIATVTKVG